MYLIMKKYNQVIYFTSRSDLVEYIYKTCITKKEIIIIRADYMRVVFWGIAEDFAKIKTEL